MLVKLTLSAVALTTLAFVPLQQGKPAAAPSGRFTIDPVHSSVIFGVRHMNASNFYGRFNEVNGKILVDADDPKESLVTLSIKTASVDTHDGKRDDHLRSPDFFNAKEFPSIDFESSKVEAKGKDELIVTGELSMHGVKKPLTITVKQTGFSTSAQMGARIGYESRFTFKRSDYNMKGYLEMLGDEVEVILAVEAGKQ